MTDWKTHNTNLFNLMNQLTVMDDKHKEVDQNQGFSRWVAETVRIRDNGNRVYFIGNGASASMSSHFSADLFKNGRVLTEVFTDLSLMTAYANDIAFDRVFAEPLKLKMKPGDMLVAISSSGNSPNVLRGAETAQQMGGFVVTLSAMKEENSLRKHGNLNFYVPAQTYGNAETCHSAILHYWLDQFMAEKHM